MKIARSFALALSAVAGLMALLGGPQALAALDTSPAGTQYKGEMLATATETLTLKASVFTVTCTASTIAGTSGVSTLSFSGCDSTVKTLSNGSGETHGSITGPHDWNVTGKKTEVTVEKFGVSCIYGTGTGTKVGILTDTSGTGGTAKVKVEASLPKQTGSGALCASLASFSGSYKITKPDSLFVD